MKKHKKKKKKVKRSKKTAKSKYINAHEHTWRKSITSEHLWKKFEDLISKLSSTDNVSELTQEMSEDLIDDPYGEGDETNRKLLTLLKENPKL